MGGCGFCQGLGCTRRRGICQYSPANSYSSFVQHPTMCSIASCHMRRLSPGSTPKPSSSARVAERPVPRSTRPVREQVEHGHRLRRPHRMVVGLGHQAHAVAEPDALGPRRDGAVEHLGIRAVRVLLEEVVLDRPEGMPAEAVAGDRLFERVLVGDELAVLAPRAGAPGSRRTGRTSWRGLPLADGHPGTSRARTVCHYQPGSPGRNQSGRCYARARGTDLHRDRGRLGHRAGHGGPPAGRGCAGGRSRPRPNPGGDVRPSPDEQSRWAFVRTDVTDEEAVVGAGASRASPSAGRSRGWSTRPAWPAAARCTCCRRPSGPGSSTST